MQKQGRRTRVAYTTLLATALITLGLVGSASAQLTGQFAAFGQCPWTNPAIERCIYSRIESGEATIGETEVPIVNPITLQGGFSEPEEPAEFSSLFGATNGITLSKTSQPVPGGLFGILPPGKSPPLLKALSSFFRNGSLSRVDSTLELARPVSQVLISQSHIAEGLGVGIIMPLKIHLENPFLGKNCYIGSSGSPVLLQVTTGTTSPPPPNQPISGGAGDVEFLEKSFILRLTGAQFVDNAWAVPKASGCGGSLGFLVNPVINAQLGLPSPAGHNTVIMKGTSMMTTTFALRKNDEEHP